MKKALLIIDVQNDYFENGAYPLPNAAMAAKNIQSVLARFRADGDLVVFIQHINMKEDAFLSLEQSARKYIKQSSQLKGKKLLSNTLRTVLKIQNYIVFCNCIKLIN